MSSDEIKRAEVDLARLKGAPTCRIRETVPDGSVHEHFEICTTQGDLQAFIQWATMFSGSTCRGIAMALWELAYTHNRRSGYTVAKIVVPGWERTFEITWSAPHERERGGYGADGRWTWSKERT